MLPDELDRLFATAQRAALVPSEALIARVLADAAAVQPLAAAQPVQPLASAQPQPQSAAGLGQLRKAWQAIWGGLTAGFGGGAVIASLGAVTVAAVFLGYSDPGGLQDKILDVAGLSAYNGVEIVPIAEYFLLGG